MSLTQAETQPVQHRTLLLTPWYMPHRVVSWKNAVTLLFLGKVEVVVSYAEELRSPSLTLQTPAVIRLKEGAGRGKLGRVSTGRTGREVRFSRGNVYLRDDFTCQYCFERLERSQLTYDHVTPRAQGGRTAWENIVTACYACNSKKGNRTPAEARMPLQKQPTRPKTLPRRPFGFDLRSVPSEWQDFCPAAQVGVA